MKKDDDGKPVVDATGKGLGVRDTPVNNRTDVDLDEGGRIVLNGKGMSVAPNWRVLPFYLVPDRLKDEVPKARANSSLYCFTMGDGPFQNGPIATALDLEIDGPNHGLIVPRVSVPIQQYQADLANTRDDWTVDES